MKTLKIQIVIFCALFSLSCLAQNLEKYSGTFGRGVAEYTYYNNQDGTRTMHGSFVAKKDIKNASNVSPYGYNISGHFLNGKRHGEWTIHFECRQGGYTSAPCNGQYILNYENGLHVGKQIYICQSSSPNDSYFNYRVEFSCQDNKINGEFQCVLEDIVYRGLYNDGKLIGRWLVTDSQYKYIYDLDKKIFYALDTETGDRFNINCFPRGQELNELTGRYMLFFESLLDPNNNGRCSYHINQPRDFNPVEF